MGFAGRGDRGGGTEGGRRMGREESIVCYCWRDVVGDISKVVSEK